MKARAVRFCSAHLVSESVLDTVISTASLTACMQGRGAENDCFSLLSFFNSNKKSERKGKSK